MPRGPAVDQTIHGKERVIQGHDAACFFALQSVQSDSRAAAGAGRGQNAGIVPGAVADQRQGLHTDGGDDQLPKRTVRQDPAVRVNDLGDDSMLPQMHTLVSGAGDGARHTHLPGTVVGEQFGTQDLLAAADHAVRTGVAADQGPPQAAPAAKAQDRQQLYRHAHIGIRLLLLHGLSVFAIAEPRAQLQGLRTQAGDGFGNKPPQPKGAGERKTDHGDAAREDQLTQSGHVKPDGVFQIPLGVKYPLGGAGGAGGGVGQHSLNFALGGQQHSGSVMGQILVSGKRETGQLGKGRQRSRKIPIETAALLFPRKKAIQLFQLNRFYALAVKRIHLFLLPDESVQSGRLHVRYSDLPSVSVRL